MPEKKYMAASVPRSIRTARLNHLPLKTVIGYWYIKQEGGGNFVYDIIMLPPDQFLRMKSTLAVPETASPSMPGHFAPPYVPKDTKEVSVPEGEPDPETYAKNHFLRAFNLPGTK